MGVYVFLARLIGVHNSCLDAVSEALRKDINTLEWVSKNVDDIADDLLRNLDGKTVERTFVDAQGRLVVMAESSNSTRTVATLEKTATGEVKSFKYTNAYNNAGQPGKPPVSANGLTPDFSGNPAWLYPVTGNQKNIVKIKLSGKRKGTDGDFIELIKKQVFRLLEHQRGILGIAWMTLIQ